jgi:hypothetical protein
MRFPFVSEEESLLGGYGPPSETSASAAARQLCGGKSDQGGHSVRDHMLREHLLELGRSTTITALGAAGVCSRAIHDLVTSGLGKDYMKMLYDAKLKFNVYLNGEEAIPLFHEQQEQDWRHLRVPYLQQISEAAAGEVSVTEKVKMFGKLVAVKLVDKGIGKLLELAPPGTTTVIKLLGKAMLYLAKTFNDGERKCLACIFGAPEFVFSPVISSALLAGIYDPTATICGIYVNEILDRTGGMIDPEKDITREHLMIAQTLAGVFKSEHRTEMRLAMVGAAMAELQFAEAIYNANRASESLPVLGSESDANFFKDDIERAIKFYHDLQKKALASPTEKYHKFVTVNVARNNPGDRRAAVLNKYFDHSLPEDFRYHEVENKVSELPIMAFCSTKGMGGTNFINFGLIQHTHPDDKASLYWTLEGIVFPEEVPNKFCHPLRAPAVFQFDDVPMDGEVCAEVTKSVTSGWGKMVPQ